MPTPPAFDVLDAVQRRYSEGAQQVVPELCCPVDYDRELLEGFPAAILERDYGCGDPSRFVRSGDDVLDLGSGAGKICYMASRLTGAAGSVIGVDATAEMLALARAHREELARVIGWSNVSFRHGRIQDLQLDRDKLQAWLATHPVHTTEDLDRLRAEESRLRVEEPLIPSDSVDLVLSNCVLNLVDPGEKARLFSEIHRVLRRGGRCAISDIVSDEDVPEAMQRDPELWSGCISGALREDRFLQAFSDAGLYGARVVEYQEEPWAVVEGIEFRSMTIVAYKGLEGACFDHNEAVIYRGPWKRVEDDDGHVYERGQRTAVCRKTLDILEGEPYAKDIHAVRPSVEVPAETAPPFDCSRDSKRSPSETKRGAAPREIAPGVDRGSSCC